METLYFLSVQGNRHHYFFAQADALDERMQHIVQQLCLVESGTLQIMDAIRIEVETLAPITEKEIRYLFRHHSSLLKKLGLFPLHRLPFLDKRLLYFIELRSPRGDGYLHIFSDEEDINGNDLALQTPDASTFVMRYDRSVKFQYREYEVIEHSEAVDQFGRYFNRKPHLRLV